MKKFIGSSVFYYFLILIISCLPLISIFDNTKLFHTHDGLVHIPRIAAYYQALKDGNFPVRWAGNLNFGYGMPLFNFMYPLPYLIASGFLFLGSGLILSFKLSMALSYLLAGIFMYGFAKAFFGDDKKAFLISIFYQFATFRFIELLTRGAFGEVYTYTFLPLVFWMLVKFFKKLNFLNFLLITLATTFLILSHNALSLVFFGLAFGFIIFFSPSKRHMVISLIALGFGLIISGFYWIPAIIEHKYTYGDLFMKDLYLSHFAPIQNFFIPNFTNSPQFQTGGISVQLGIFHILAIIAAIGLLWRKKQDIFLRKVIVGCLVVLIITFFFMQPVSKPLWAHLSLLRQFQFPWRILGVTSFITAILAVTFFVYDLKKTWVYILLILLVILSSIGYWYKAPLGYDKVNEAYYWNFPLDTTYYGETDVIWSAGPAKSYPKNRIVFASGNGQIKNLSKRNKSQTFTVVADKPSTIVSNTEYFPGWRVYINGALVPIQFQNPNWRGLITFQVPKGTSQVRVIFGETPVRLAADTLSIIGIILLIMLGIARNYIFYDKKRN